MRADLQVDTITMPATGFLSMSKDAAASKNYLSPAGFKKDWVDWSDRQLAQFFQREALHFATIGPPTSNRSGVCSTDKQLCFGDCFLDELPPDFLRRSQWLLNATRRLPYPRARLHVYQNSGISTGRHAAEKHAGCAITDQHGKPTAYHTCAAGQDMPLFFANGSNSWSHELEAVYRKLVALGYDGGARGSFSLNPVRACSFANPKPSSSVYHDEFLGCGTDYTFSVWDTRSGQLDPITKRVTRLLGSVALLTQQHEMKLMDIVKDAGGSMIANGQPGTRTLREYCRAGKSGTVAGGPAGANLHFREDSPQFGAVHTHLFTPISLNRYGGQRQDLDPKYNKTCPSVRKDAIFMDAECVAKNIDDNLDFGVATFLCECSDSC